MPVNSQVRIPLNKAMQQSAASPVAALVSQQYPNGGNPFMTNFVLLVDYDRFVADATDGDIVATVPLATDLVKGKPYIVQKKGATNTVTVTLSGDDEYEGSPTIALTGDGDSVAFISDGAVLHRAFPSQTPGEAPDGALAASNNLSDLDSAPTALTNLGGTTVGKAVFTAVDEAAARTAIGAPAATAVVLKADKFTFGPVALDTVAANADAVRFRPGFAGTLTAMVLDLSKSAAGLDGTVVVTPTVAGGATTPASAQHAAAAVAGAQVDTAITNGGAFTADQEIVLATTGTNTVAGKTMVTLEYTRT